MWSCGPFARHTRTLAVEHKMEGGEESHGALCSSYASSELQVAAPWVSEIPTSLLISANKQTHF